MAGIEIGIMAHNEAGNLDALLSRLVLEPETARICIVSSGSTDGTDQIARRWATHHPQVQAIIEPQRRGKARAINRFLSVLQPDTTTVVLISGDVLPCPGSLGRLLRPLRNPKVQMTGGRPCPINPVGGVINKIVHFQWALLDCISRERPKLGEMIAFRAPIEPLVPDTVVDEAALEAQFTQHAGTLAYVPEATLSNQGPQRLGDLIDQRERIWIGHRLLWKRTGYRVSTSRIVDLCGPAFRYLLRHPKAIPVAIAGAAVEIFARLRGRYRHGLLGLTPTIWHPISSAKIRWRSPSFAQATWTPPSEVRRPSPSAGSNLSSSPESSPEC
jgi:biofilm PGA synthesis N-glycosyltransferase PgaC